MDNFEKYIYSLVIVYAIINFYAFKEQRILLEISRDIDYDIRPILMPLWCSITAHLSWPLIPFALYIMYRYSIINGIVMLFIILLLPGCIPFSTSNRTKAYKSMAKYIDKYYCTFCGVDSDYALNLVLALKKNPAINEEVLKYRKHIDPEDLLKQARGIQS